jgi:hypothetical protein
VSLTHLYLVACKLVNTAAAAVRQQQSNEYHGCTLYHFLIRSVLCCCYTKIAKISRCMCTNLSSLIRVHSNLYRYGPIRHTTSHSTLSFNIIGGQPFSVLVIFEHSLVKCSSFIPLFTLNLTQVCLVCS